MFQILVEDADISLFGDAEQATESGPDAKVVSMIQNVVSRALAEGFRSATFYSAVIEAVEKNDPDPLNVDTVAAQ